MGFVLTIVGAAVKTVLQVLSVLLIKTKLWAAIVVYLLAGLIFPAWNQQDGQLVRALLGLGATALLWLPSIKKIKTQAETEQRDENDLPL